MEHINELRIANAKQDANLEDQPAQEESKEANEGIEGATSCAMHLVRVDQPANADVRGRHLDKEKHDSED